MLLLVQQGTRGYSGVADGTAPKGVISELWHLCVLILQADSMQEL